MHVLNVHFPQRRLVAGVAIGVLVGVIGVGTVTAASPTPSGGSSSGPAAVSGLRPGPAALRQLVGHNFRVDVAATNQTGTRNILYVRGTIAVTATSVTVALPDGSTQAFTVDSATVLREKGETVAYSTLTNGERAMVFGSKNADGSYTARLIRCVKQRAESAVAAPSASATP